MVGASAGIGRAVVDELAASGSRCVAVSRRPVEGLPGGSEWQKCDVRSAGECYSAVDAAAYTLGGLDALVYCAGVSSLGALEDMDAAAWQDLLSTNLVGAALMTAAALPHLRATRGRAVFLSSHSVERPWPGLVAYASTKAALDTLAIGWRAECPEVQFTRVVVGPTITGFADTWDPDAAGDYFDRWQREGYFESGVSRPEDVAEQVVNVLSAPVRVDTVRVMPPPA